MVDNYAVHGVVLASLVFGLVRFLQDQLQLSNKVAYWVAFSVGFVVAGLALSSEYVGGLYAEVVGWFVAAAEFGLSIVTMLQLAFARPSSGAGSPMFDAISRVSFKR